MLLRPRTLTPASLAARRANALKSTGPRTEQGKARVALNPLMHGRSAVNLPEKLARAGYRQDVAEWRAIRARIARVFEPTFGPPEPGEDSAPARDPLRENRHRQNQPHDPETGEAKKCRQATGPYPNCASLGKKMDRLSNWVWCSHRNWQQQSRAKLKPRLQSGNKKARLATGGKTLAPPQIRIHNPWARLGLVFYTQLRRGWALRVMTTLSLRRMKRGPGGPGRVEPGEIGPAMETGLRSRVHPLARPRFWERLRYCLDPDGNYHPEWRGRFRQYRRELRNSPMAMWLEPHPILATLRQHPDWQAEYLRNASEAGKREADSPDFGVV